MEQIPQKLYTKEPIVFVRDQMASTIIITLLNDSMVDCIFSLNDRISCL